MTTPTTLDDLLEILTTSTDHGLDWAELPTYGGETPRDTSGIWSWDETRLLVGTCASDLRIVEREYYHCQIEGDESAVIEATSAEQAARRYVRGGDWSPEEDGWSGTGTLHVWVAPCDRTGAHNPADCETVPVLLRDGHVVLS